MSSTRRLARSSTNSTSSTICFAGGTVAEVDLGLRARSMLDGCSTMTLATCGPSGPWAAVVFFASDGLGEHYFISSPGSRHTRDALASGMAAATIHPDPGGDWRTIRG